jgi:hypothetical protein
VSHFFYSFAARIADEFSDVFEGEGDPRGIKAQFGKRWGWFAVVHQLAQGDVLHVEAVTGSPLKQCLMWLSYEVDKMKVDAALQKVK